MSNELVPVTGLFKAPSRVERQAAKEIAVVEATGAVRAARGKSMVEATREVTEEALLAAAEISSLEALLLSRVPHADSRLTHIADAGTARIADVVLRMGKCSG